MIGRIRGRLVHKQAPVILVEVGGVGYELQVPMTTLFQLPELNEQFRLLQASREIRRPIGLPLNRWKNLFAPQGRVGLFL